MLIFFQSKLRINLVIGTLSSCVQTTGGETQQVLQLEITSLFPALLFHKCSQAVRKACKLKKHKNYAPEQINGPASLTSCLSQWLMPDVAQESKIPTQCT